jgi:hypothetical protein
MLHHSCWPRAKPSPLKTAGPGLALAAPEAVALARETLSRFR